MMSKMMSLNKILPDGNIYSNLNDQEFKLTFESADILKTILLLFKSNQLIAEVYNFIVLLNNGADIRTWNIVSPNNRKCIFIVYDESGRIPTELLEHRDNIVFHAYLNFQEWNKPYPNLFHYPLGCNSFVPELPYVPVDKRRFNVFFSGNLHAGRKKLYQSLSGLTWLPLPLLTRIQHLAKRKFDHVFAAPSYVRFTEGFSKGLSVEEYSYYLSNSKILISPPGISNKECFRHYEGLRAGCLVVTEQLPDKPQYNSSPIIMVKNWTEGIKLINSILENQVRLEKLSIKSRDWYQNQLSPEAQVQYIINAVASLKEAITE